MAGKKVFGLATGLCALLLLSGCASAPFYGRNLSDRIADDAIDFNKAYTETVSAQLLLNILYARDRLPRQYMGFSSITTRQMRSLQVNPSIGAIPFGNPLGRGAGAQWGAGALSVTGSASSNPTYGVTPLVKEDLTKAVFNPIPVNTFNHYWERNWPEDLLLFLFVDSAKMSHLNGLEITFVDVKGMAKARKDYAATFQRLTEEKRSKLIETRLTFASAIGAPGLPEKLFKDRFITHDKIYLLSKEKEAFIWTNTTSAFTEKCAGSLDGRSRVNLAYDTKRACYYYDWVRHTSIAEHRLPTAANGASECKSVMTLSSNGSLALDADLLKAMAEAKGAGFTVKKQKDAVDDTESVGVFNCTDGQKTARISALHPVFNVGQGDDSYAKQFSERQTEKNNKQDAISVTYELDLRSLDGMIYYLGQLLRSEDPLQGEKAHPQATLRRMVTAIGVPSDAAKISFGDDAKQDARAPLFYAVNESFLRSVPSKPENYAARVRYRGKTYVAGPPIASELTCKAAGGTPKEDGRRDYDCEDVGPAYGGDRTVTVLSLLGQIFLLNQSPETLLSPQRVLLQ